MDSGDTGIYNKSSLLLWQPIISLLHDLYLVFILKIKLLVLTAFTTVTLRRLRDKSVRTQSRPVTTEKVIIIIIILK